MQDAVFKEIAAGKKVPYSFARAFQYKKLLSMLKRLSVDGKDCLDWGCGAGHFSRALQMEGANVTAFDVMERDINIPGIRFVQGSTEEPSALPFEAKEFDRVFSVGVLEHVRETGGTEEASLKEIHRILRDDGYFVCYHLPTKTSWVDYVSRFIPGKHRHEFRYTRPEIETLVRDAGFDLIEIKKYGVLPKKSLDLVPRVIRDKDWFIKLYYALDDVLIYPFYPIAVNWSFIAKKRP